MWGATGLLGWLINSLNRLSRLDTVDLVKTKVSLDVSTQAHLISEVGSIMIQEWQGCFGGTPGGKGAV